MPEHVHILVLPRQENYRVRNLLQSIKQPVARKAIAHLRETNPAWLANLRNPKTGAVHFWQPGGGFDRNVEEVRTAWSIVEYIHANPVKRGLVDHPLGWPWSSARWYAGEGEVLLAMDGTPPMR